MPHRQTEWGIFMQTIKPGSIVHRSFSVDRAAINEDSRTVELAFSSEQPYERWWGVEILDHSQTSIRLGRLAEGGPLLMDHDSRDHVGVIESVQIGADRVGRAVVRFGRGARADEVYNDVKDGIRRNVSVGYVIHKATLVETGDDDVGVYRVNDWEPFEVSLVAVPADASVGVGRAADEAAGDAIEFIESKSERVEIMTDQVVDQAAIRDQAHKDANKRASDIMAIGEQFAHYGADKLVGDALRSGDTVEQFREKVLAKVSAAPKPTAEIGMTRKEAKNFSFLRAINALANPGDRKAQEAASFEREASDAFSSKLGRSAQGFFVPLEVQQRDLNVTTATAGGNVVGTNLLAANFIDMLRNRMMVSRMGAQTLSGLVGNIAIPRQTGGATAYWVAESGAPTESAAAFDQVTMTPRTVGAFSDISRKLLLQSSIDVEGFVRSDLATVLAMAIDLAAINGTGSGNNQPTGILGTSGIGDVAGGTNGAAPTWANIIELWSDLAIANADFGTTGVLTNAKVIGKLMGTLKASGIAGYIVEDFPDANGITNVGGLRGGVSNQVPSNLVKAASGAVCSAIIAGNWNDLIVGQWGTLDLMVDPYTGSTSGTVRVVALQDVDVAVRHAESFAAMKDALTA